MIQLTSNAAGFGLKVQKVAATFRTFLCNNCGRPSLESFLRHLVPFEDDSFCQKAANGDYVTFASWVRKMPQEEKPTTRAVFRDPQFLYDRIRFGIVLER